MQTRLVARLTAPVVAVSVLLVAVAIGAAWYARDSQRRVSEMLDSHVASVLAAQELEISLREVQLQFDRYLRYGDPSHLKHVPGLRRRAYDALAVAKVKAVTDQEQVLMKQVEKELEHFFEQYDRLERSPPPEGKYADVRKLIDNDLARVLKPAGEYLKINEAMLNRASETNKELSQRLTVGMIGLGVCGSVAGLLAGWVIAVSLRRSLLDTDRVLRDTAARLDEAAHLPAAGAADPPGTALQRVTHAAAAVLNRLKQTERDALRAEQLAWVGQMAAGIAHEVRNPLTVIKLLVQAATDPRRATGFRPQDLRVLEDEILRLEQIVRTFLDFARPPRPEKKPVEPGDLIRGCLAGVGARAELQGVEVRLAAPPDLPPLDADPGQLAAGALQPAVQRARRAPRGRDDSGDCGRRRRGAGGAGRRHRAGAAARSGGADLRAVRQHQGDGAGAGAVHLPADRRGPRRDARRGERPGRRGGVRDPAAVRRAAGGATRGRRSDRSRVMPKLLIIDDEPSILYSLKAAWRATRRRS